ncbi:MAG: DUF4340 domain-containing protein [Candidatus Latescibacterota bacterium]|nr:MAG: DUF4340 domain-containing protein [Candidatus Latescibacterota bacterium]
MRFKTTAILIAIAAVVLAYFFFVEQPRHKRHVARTGREAALTKHNVDEITRVSITRPDVTLTFERENNIWQMLEPTADEADQSSVNTLIHTVINAQIERRFSIGETGLAEYGLDQPSATIRLAVGSGGDDLVLRVGDFALTKHNCFVRVGDGSDV